MRAVVRRVASNPRRCVAPRPTGASNWELAELAKRTLDVVPRGAAKQVVDDCPDFFRHAGGGQATIEKFLQQFLALGRLGQKAVARLAR